MQKRILILGAVISAGALGIWAYQIYTGRHPSTEDAYIDADVVRVAPRVTGRVMSLDVSNHQHVAKGDLLFTIDPEPFQFAVQQADAQLALARREVSQATAAVASAEAELNNQKVLLDNAKTKLKRARRLTKQNYISAESITNAEADYKSAQANVQLAQAKLEEARRQQGVAGDDNDRIVQAKSQLQQAQWELDNTKVSAACPGQISELKLQPGNVVSADQDVFVLVCSQRYWVDANYKETQLEHIHPGQPANVVVDMYPDHPFKGVVQSVSAAAGSAFSLLPPQNANGNWVKVTQRIPVRIKIEHPDPAYPLLVGASTSVTIDTTASKDKAHLAANEATGNAAPQVR